MIRISPVRADNDSALDFIEHIYTESFPPDERRDFDEVVRLLRENDDFAIALLSDEEHPIGFISYWSWSDFTYMEHFAIDSRCRGAGYGAAAMTALLEQAGKGNEQRTCIWLDWLPDFDLIVVTKWIVLVLLIVAALLGMGYGTAMVVSNIRNLFL